MNISTKILISYIIIVFISGAAQYSAYKAFTLATETINAISKGTMPFIFAINDLRTAGLRILAHTNEFAMIKAEKCLMADGNHVESDPVKFLYIKEKKEEDIIKRSNEMFDTALETVKEHITHIKANKEERMEKLVFLEKHGNLFRKKCLEMVDLKKKGVSGAPILELKDLPVDILKIDRSFIMEIPEKKDDMAITRTILSMARELGLKVVAEGVETKEQLDFLRAHNCEMMQGFFFSPPVPPDEFELLLREKRSLSFNKI